MATTSARLLTLLSLLGARSSWSGPELADRLGTSTRTLRRDVESLRELGYPVHARMGPDGGYRLGSGSKLPPILLDDEQALAVAVALQTAPASVAGIDDAVARALTSIKNVMPARLRAEVEAMHLTAIRNSWDFAAAPIAADTLKAVGSAIRAGHLLFFELPDRRRRPAAPGRGAATPGRTPPPGDLGRALVPGRLRAGPRGLGHLPRRPDPPPGRDRDPFQRRELPERSVARYVMHSYDRGDTPARWQCLGVVLMELPADVVARWAPGGSVIEYIAPTLTRLTLGAWSWAGIAGLLATFDADITIIEPDELRAACRTIAERYQRAGLR